jgi:hypothetical protein
LADLLDGLAQYLQGLGLLDYDLIGGTGDAFLEAMPAAPDECVVLTLYGGPEPSSLHGYDEPNLQVRVRGGADPRVSRTRALALYDALQGLGPVTLPDGSRLISCFAHQTVSSMGLDELRRFEHVCNYALTVRAITAHRV